MVVYLQGLRLVQGGLPGLHRVYDVFLYLSQLLPGQLAVEQVDLGAAHLGPVGLGDYLDALGGGVGPLVELAGEILHGKDLSAFCTQLRADHIQLGLGEHGFYGVVEELRGDVLHVVAVDYPELFQALYTQQTVDILFQVPGLLGQFRLLFNKYTVYHTQTS